VTWAIENKNYSQARACTLIGLAPKTYRYRSKRDGDEPVRKRLRELAQERRRFGYRRLHLLLCREGMTLNLEKLYRLYREERLTVRKRGGRKRALGTRAPMTIPQGVNQRWSLDFVSDALSEGRRFRVLRVIDDFSRECLALVADNSLSGIRVSRELNRIAELRGYPCLIAAWRVGPHTSLGGLTPAEFATRPATGHNQNGAGHPGHCNYGTGGIWDLHPLDERALKERLEDAGRRPPKDAFPANEPHFEYD
jgi:hypothetical protein